MNQQADDLFGEGLAMALIDEHQMAIRKLESAIELGLSHNDEMQARYYLGDGYGHLINTEVSVEQIIKSHEFTQALTQQERAVQMDAEKGYQYFRKYRSFIFSLDLYYTLVGGVIKETQGDNAVINYYLQKLSLFNYLPTQPLLKVLLELGVIYRKRGDEENAHRCFLAIRNAEPIMPEDEMEIQVRQKAENNLSLSETETPAKTGCFIATAVYGEAAPELYFFRLFRDGFLLKSIVGKVFVSFYYSFSPRIAKWLKKSEYAKQFVKIILLQPFLYLIKSGAKETKSTPKNY